MAFIATAAFWNCVRRDNPAALGVVVSQVPFWAGVVAWLPHKTIWVDLNMILSLATAAVFYLLAQVFGGVAFIAVCLVFVTATLHDVSASLFGANYYLELHEILHYLALIGMVGRTYVDRIVSDFRTRRFDGESR